MKKTSCLIASKLFYKEERAQCNVIKSLLSLILKERVRGKVINDPKLKLSPENVNKVWHYCLFICFIYYLFVCLLIYLFIYRFMYLFSCLIMVATVSLMHHDPNRSWITDPDPDHPKERTLQGEEAWESQ